MSAVITAVAIGVIGAGFAAYSSYQQGQAAKRLSNYNAAIEDQAALVAQRDAAAQANVKRQQDGYIMAKQRAAFAANGLVGETGSPLLVQVNTASNLTLDALEVERVGAMKASQHRQQATLDRMSGKAAAQAGNLNAASNALQGLSSAAGTYAGYKGVG